jgi:hypothetical protein
VSQAFATAQDASRASAQCAGTAGEREPEADRTVSSAFLAVQVAFGVAPPRRLLRIPMIATNHFDVSRPPAPIGRDQGGAA